MKDNGLKKVFQSFRTEKDRHIAKLRRRWQQLSYRQQRVIILYLLGLFAAIDLAYIVGGFCGTDKFPIEVRHLQRIALENDTLLVAKLREGNKFAFEALYEKYSAKLYNTIILLVYDKSLAKDITQSSFMAIWEKRSNLGTP